MAVVQWLDHTEMCIKRVLVQTDIVTRVSILVLVQSNQIQSTRSSAYTLKVTSGETLM